MRIVLINQFYPPARAPTGVLMADLAETLVQRGHSVTVVTSAVLYGKIADGDTGHSGIEIIRLGARREHRVNRLSKIWDYADFYVQARRQLGVLDPRPDVVVSLTTPPFCGRMAQRVLALRRVPHVLWCMDLYPEALQAAGWLRSGNPVYGYLSRLAARERSGAAAVVVLGDDMADKVHALEPNAYIKQVPVWSTLAPTSKDHEAAQMLRRARGWEDDQCVLLYSGNMGRAHDVSDFARLATRLDAGKFRFVLCGEGPLRQVWRERWGSVFEWLPPVETAALTTHLLAADVHLLSQQPQWQGVVVPSKYQSACALGKPVLFSGPVGCAVERWIAEGDTGWHLPSGRDTMDEHIISDLAEPDIRARKQAGASRQANMYFNPEKNREELARIIENTVSLINT